MTTIPHNNLSGAGTLHFVGHGWTDHVNLKWFDWPVPVHTGIVPDPDFMGFVAEDCDQTKQCLPRYTIGRGESPIRLQTASGQAFRLRGWVVRDEQDPLIGRIRLASPLEEADECDRLEEVPEFSQLRLDAKLWRYMSLPQFCDLGQTGELYMPSITSFTKIDPYEGWWPVVDTGFDIEPDPWPWLASSWCLSEYNNYALWELYGSRQGVAIQTTVGRLRSFLHIGDYDNTPHQQRHLFRVAYLDYDKHDNMLAGWPGGQWRQDERLPYLCKRREFAHEQEVRVLRKIPDFIMDNLRADMDGKPDPGYTLHSSEHIHPEKSVETVYAHPQSESYVRRVIWGLMKQWGWGAEFIGNMEPIRDVPPFVR